MSEMEVENSDVNCEMDGVKASDEKCEESNDNLSKEIESALFKQTSLFELCRSSWHPLIEKNGISEDIQTYLKGCKWSPDGTCCLTVVNNNGMHILELPQNLYEGSSIISGRSVDILDTIVHVPECGAVYDYCWYPGMNSAVPESCCWITTRQNAPLQMWDAFDGSLRCSYRGYNVVDEMEPALSVCFSNDGSLIYAGYKKSIKTFHTERPGRDYIDQPIMDSAASLTVSPCGEIIAVGSWKTGISLYDTRDDKIKSIGKMHGHKGGVTHLRFFHDGNYLLSGARKDDQLLIWDIRFYRKPLKVLHRKVKTNQRIYFDISSCARYLVSGSTDGIVYVWNLTEQIQTDTNVNASMYPLHKDCCNGISIHPYRPILATSAGQFHITNTNLDNNDVKENLLDIKKEINDENCESVVQIHNSDLESINEDIIENSLEFWWTGDIAT